MQRSACHRSSPLLLANLEVSQTAAFVIWCERPLGITVSVDSASKEMNVRGHAVCLSVCEILCCRLVNNSVIAIHHPESCSKITIVAVFCCIGFCSLAALQLCNDLSAVKCYSNRRLLSRFRSGCHGLRVDTGRWEHNVHLDRTDRLC